MNTEKPQFGQTPTTICFFDLGKASIGEVVRDVKVNDFLHKTSLLWAVFSTI